MKALNLVVFWLKIAFLFLLRSLRSTGMLSLMLLSAVASLIFLSALAVGVNDAMIRNSVSLYSGHISGFNIPKTISPQSLKMEGVTAVLKRRIIPGDLEGKNKTHDAFLTQIVPREERDITAIAKKIVAGAFLPDTKGALLIGQSLAEKLEAKPGDKLKFRPVTGGDPIELSVSGIYRTGIEPLDNETAFCPPGTVPDASSSWSAAIFLKEGVNPSEIIAACRDKLPAGSELKSWEELMPDLKQLIDLNYVSMSIVILLVFGVVSLGIACAFVIFILKNIREYGIIKSMGVTTAETMLLIIYEVLLMNIMASGLGIIIGVIISLIVQKTGIDLSSFTSQNRYFAVSGMVYPRLTPFAWGVPPALAIIFSLIAAIWPAALVARRRAAELLRIV